MAVSLIIDQDVLNIENYIVAWVTEAASGAEGSIFVKFSTAETLRIVSKKNKVNLSEQTIDLN